MKTELAPTSSPMKVREAQSLVSILVVATLVAGGLFTHPIFSSAPFRGLNVIATVPVNGHPHGIAFDTLNGEIYATNFNTGTVSVINGSTNTVVANVSLGEYSFPVGIVFDSLNGNLYVSDTGKDEFQGAVSVISGSTNAALATISVGTRYDHPEGIAFDKANGLVYVSMDGSLRVLTINGSTNSQVGVVRPYSAPGYVAYDSTDGNLYTVGTNGPVSVINGSNNQLAATVPYGGNPVAIAYDSYNNDIYVLSAEPNATTVIDCSTNMVIRNVSSSSAPSAIAFDPLNGAVFETFPAGPSSPGSLSLINDSTTTLITSTRVGTMPLGVAFDSLNGDVYVANQVSGTVSVVSPSSTPTTTTTNSKTSSSRGNSGIPEYPFVPVAAIAVVFAVVLSYVAARRIARPPPLKPSLRFSNGLSSRSHKQNTCSAL